MADSIPPVLIFPAGMPLSLDFLHRCQQQGLSVIGCSSLPADPAREHYSHWEWLPMITDPGFDAALASLLRQYGVREIFTPNLVVWNYLQQHLSDISKNVRLLNDSPANEAVGSFRLSRQRADEKRRWPLMLASPPSTRARLSPLQLAAIYQHAQHIPGMCDEEKIFALTEVAPHVPVGDVVEIGSWWGKSAYVLAMLCQHYGLGRLLCVDPWQNALLKQADADRMVDQVAMQLDADEAFAIFLMNLAPFAGSVVNYLRLPSVAAAAVYRQNRDIVSEGFGQSRFQGRIALLHIDGNHSQQAVTADVQAWADLVMPGGWIVFDDYVWPYGEGPKVVADHFVADNVSRLACVFAAGSALFIQFAGD